MPLYRWGAGAQDPPKDTAIALQYTDLPLGTLMLSRNLQPYIRCPDNATGETASSGSVAVMEKEDSVNQWWARSAEREESWPLSCLLCFPVYYPVTVQCNS